ncbi:MAG: NAD-glutamate dehydrogenase, partial [Nocardioidaceae bacterium]|nr:NAD-glutamate dehydrogenase [Nocardioidaceae bacterium]
RSHSGKAVLDFMEKFPRDELFQASLGTLTEIADSVLHMQQRRRLRLFVRRDDYGRFLSCIVYLPRDRYNTRARLRMQSILASAVGGEPTVDFTARVTESVLARVYLVVRPPLGQVVPEVDVRALEQRLADAIRSWEDDLARAAREMLDEGEAMRLVSEYADAFPEAYKEDFGAGSAVHDLLCLENIDPDDGIALELYPLANVKAGEGRLKIFSTGEPLSLSQVLPLLTSLGVEVVDERPYRIETPEGPARVYDFGLRYRGEISEATGELFQDAFLACWRGIAEVDGFNRLVTSAGMPWRWVTVLRAYARYLRQAGTTFSSGYIEASLLANVPIARLLVDLFEARFDPGRQGAIPAEAESRVAKTDELVQRIYSALDGVASLDQDRILRSYLTLVCATLRTNYFQMDADGNAKPYLALKLEPARIEDLPRPKPRFEIFVYSPRVEGVHLRFGYVARGGLRWSDRREDYRTEVLGLVKAQMVKNAVIVPVGAKGGFYCKQLPDPTTDRDAWLVEGIACYTTFVSGLLDITDNRVDRRNVPPPSVVCHDGEDAYLVVAADKGTAAFSDIANGVAADYGFWLGDAFASGGSDGYDHKSMGITARGAWVSVQRHFREMGIDTRSDDFSCVGIGDMSGDVFGNCMLLSQHIRLLAAFDHRHIFIDPDPDPDDSHAERARLFALPRSSWGDYDPARISAGGGVFDRTLKSVPVTEPMRAALGLDAGTQTMTPPELITAILRAPVDLLWNGGIGTYVKASTEANADVGDKANDAIRVDGAELRCKAVAEGGNIGLTQLGRIEYARAGGRINTDFVDNSAGVDTSDHEVNIKILLDRVVAQGGLSHEDRNALLVEMTDEVATLVLRDNYDQNIAMASAVAQAPALLHVHSGWMRRLEKAGRLDRTLEFLPSQKEIDERLAAGQGLTAPELAVLLAYTKIVLADELLDSDVPDDPFLRNHLFGYFPSAMRQGHRRQMDEHPLRREIVATKVVNDFVNGAGITFFHRLSGETAATTAELARAHAVAEEIFGTRELMHQVNELDNEVAAELQVSMRLSIRTLSERATRWLVTNRRHLDAAAAVEHFDPVTQQVVRALPTLLVGRQLDALKRRAARLVSADVPDELASRIASLPPAYSALGIVDIARRDGVDALEAARLHFALSERLGLDRLVERIVALPRDDRWRTMARATLRDDLYAVQAQLTVKVLMSTPPEADPQQRIDAWVQAEGPVLKRSTDTLAEIYSDDAADLARLSVALRIVRSLL